MIAKIKIKKIYIHYWPLVFRRSLFLLKNKQEAADTARDVFIKLLKKNKMIKNINLPGYLYKTATNTCLNILRNKKKQNLMIKQNFLTKIPQSINMEYSMQIKLNIQSTKK